MDGEIGIETDGEADRGKDRQTDSVISINNNLVLGNKHKTDNMLNSSDSASLLLGLLLQQSLLHLGCHLFVL